MIELVNAQKKYGKFELNASMEIPSGRITGLVGKNGAGKSTVIKLVLGLISADSGEVETLCKPANALSPQDKMNLGVTLAEAGFCPQFTINEVELILRNMYPEFDKEFFKSKCHQLGLPKEKRIREFSTGMKAKLRVLIAVSHKAKLLILDEPTSGLDVEARNEVLDMLREYMALDEERSILITSHISTDLENLCDDIYMIHNGEMVLHEETDAILEQYGIVKVNENEYEKLEKEYILKSQKTKYGYACFVKDKKFYQENYPELVIENGGIDELILMMTGGYKS